MPVQYPAPGEFNVLEYVVSAVPWLTASSVGAISTNEHQFDFVSSFVTVRNTSVSGSIQVGFTNNGARGSNFFSVSGSQSVTYDWRCRGLFIHAPIMPQTYEIAVGLTAIPARNMNDVSTLLSGVGSADIPYEPITEGGLILDLDVIRSSKWQDTARTIPVTSNSDPVKVWDDISGLDNHVFAPSDSARATYSASGMATGRPGIVYDGVDDVLSTANSVSLPVGTTFFVGKISTTGYNGFIKQALTATSASSEGFICYHSGLVNVIFGNASTIWYQARTIPAIVSTDRIMLVQGWGASFASIIIRKNGSNAGWGAASGAYAAPGTLPLHIGIGYTGTGVFTTCTIAKVLVFNRRLDEAAIVRVETKLRADWGTP